MGTLTSKLSGVAVIVWAHNSSSGLVLIYNMKVDFLDTSRGRVIAKQLEGVTRRRGRVKPEEVGSRWEKTHRFVYQPLWSLCFKSFVRTWHNLVVGLCTTFFFFFFFPSCFDKVKTASWDYVLRVGVIKKIPRLHAPVLTLLHLAYRWFSSNQKTLRLFQ